jgi:hypothetical protein
MRPVTDGKHRVATSLSVGTYVGHAARGIRAVKGVGDDDAKNDKLPSIQGSGDFVES